MLRRHLLRKNSILDRKSSILDWIYCSRESNNNARVLNGNHSSNYGVDLESFIPVNRCTIGRTNSSYSSASQRYKAANVFAAARGLIKPSVEHSRNKVGNHEWNHYAYSLMKLPRNNGRSYGSIRQFSSKISDITRPNDVEEEDEDDEEGEEGEDDEEHGEFEEVMEHGEQEAPKKTYYRAKQLVTILKKKQEDIYKEFTLRHKKKFYTFQNGVFYEFNSSKEIIIDADAILKSKNEKNKKLLRNSQKETRRDYVSTEKHEKTPVIVILGHFNHGKTTLLDALGNFSIVSKEAHGITQEIRTCHVPLRTDTSKASVTFIDTPGKVV